MLQTMKRFANKGFYVAAVNLYESKSVTTHAAAFKLMKSINSERAYSMLEAATHHLKKSSNKIAIIGFSMGATYAINAAVKLTTDVSATVLIYGTPLLEKEKLEPLNHPVLAITGSRDNPHELFAFSEIMNELEKLAEIYIYPGAKHAYAQPLFNGSKNLNETATRLTWLLTDNFLSRHLN